MTAATGRPEGDENMRWLAMRWLERWRGPLVVGAAVLSLVTPGVGALAQATPAATPGAAQGRCDVAPTTPARLVAALEAATPQPLPVLSPDALPAGEPADAATVAAVEATVTEAVACRNLGDFPRAYALFTDAMIGHLLGRRDTVPPEVLQALAEPRRIQRPFRVQGVAITGVTALPDGRVGAEVVTQNATHIFTDYLYFAPVDGAWLIDEAVSLAIVPIEGTPTP